MNWKIKAVILLLIGGLSYWAGRMTAPETVRTETVEVEKEVIKERKNIVTRVEFIEEPDGTKIRRETIEDKTITNTEKDAHRRSESLIERGLPQYRLHAKAMMHYQFTGRPEYEVGIERRLTGPISVGVWGNTKKEVGVSLSWEF